MKKQIFFVFGWITFILGLIGVVMPFLPTTPFILLSTYLFARSSKKYENWVKRSKVYKKYVLPFKQNGGLIKRQKIEILSSSYLVLLISGILISNIYTRMILISIAVGQLIVMLRIPTIDPEKVNNGNSVNDSSSM